MPTSKVDISRREVFQALVVSLVIVVTNEGVDLGLKVAGQIVVFQQDAVLQGLMPTLDLALGLWVIRRTTDMLHLLAFHPLSEFAGNITGAIVREQARLVNDIGLIAT